MLAKKIDMRLKNTGQFIANDSYGLNAMKGNNQQPTTDRDRMGGEIENSRYLI